MRFAACRALLAALTVVAAACGDKASPTTPDPPVTLSAPGVLAPADDLELDASMPDLVVSNVTSSRAGERRYDFQVSESSSFAAESGLPGVVATKSVLEGSNGRTATTIDQTLRAGVRHYWRARAVQASTMGPWSATSRFRTAPIRPAPFAPPAVLEPPDNVQLDTLRPRLVVGNSSEAGGGPRSYEFQLADNASFAVASGFDALTQSTIVAEGTGGSTAWQIQQDLKAGTRHYWRARVLASGMIGQWSAVRRFVTALPKPNDPPLIRSLSASKARAEVSEQIQLTATVEDAETAPGTLSYQWSAPAGAFTGTGVTTMWQAPPTLPAPTTYTLTLTVIERYSYPNPDGGDVTRENRATASVPVDVNDSIAELTSLSLTFLDDFSDSRVSPDTCVRNFSDNCRGKQSELNDIIANRATFVILGATYRVNTITFNGPNRAEVRAPCEFQSRRKSTGQIEIAKGTCVLTGVYESKRWFLCESRFTTSTSLWFIF